MALGRWWNNVVKQCGGTVWWGQGLSSVVGEYETDWSGQEWISVIREVLNGVVWVRIN